MLAVSRPARDEIFAGAVRLRLKRRDFHERAKQRSMPLQ